MNLLNNIKIRLATLEDAERLLEIYKPYVTDTAVSFEYEVPTVENFRSRIENTLATYPYLVAVVDGVIAGYAYAGAFIKRPAYDWSAEASIYLDMDMKGQGIGSALYAKLEEILAKQNVLNVNACIAYIEEEDQYLTNASMYFHEACGYRLVGQFTNSGCKFGKWYHMIWMEKIIGEHVTDPAPFKKFEYYMF